MLGCKGLSKYGRWEITFHHLVSIMDGSGVILGYAWPPKDVSTDTVGMTSIYSSTGFITAIEGHYAGRVVSLLNPTSKKKTQFRSGWHLYDNLIFAGLVID